MKTLELFLLIVMLLLLSSCKGSSKLVIFHAGSLARPMKDLKTAFEHENPGAEVILEAAGSRACCRKLSELNRRADIICVSDYLVIENLLMPDHAKWHLGFAGNSMGIAYDEHSKFGNEINSENWYETLVKDNVSFGYSDPDLDPCGYRTELVWKLADKNRSEKIWSTLSGKAEKRNMRPTEIELVALLQNYAIDYAFQYQSVARQYNLKFLELPEEINLSSPDKEALYERVSVKITGKQPEKRDNVKGTPIRYALTVPEGSSSKEQAFSFIRFMLSEKGKAIFKKNYQDVISPPIPSDVKQIPQALKEVL